MCYIRFELHHSLNRPALVDEPNRINWIKINYWKYVKLFKPFKLWVYFDSFSLILVIKSNNIIISRNIHWLELYCHKLWACNFNSLFRWTRSLFLFLHLQTLFLYTREGLELSMTKIRTKFNLFFYSSGWTTSISRYTYHTHDIRTKIADIHEPKRFLTVKVSIARSVATHRSKWNNTAKQKRKWKGV